MQYAWQFSHPDTWTPLADHPVCKDNEDYMKVMAAAGYRQTPPLGSQSSVGYAEIWQAKDRAHVLYPFIVDVTLPDTTMATVCMATIPDFLAYCARYGAISLASLVDEMHSMLDKLSRRIKY
jgi:hypothetical protein